MRGMSDAVRRALRPCAIGRKLPRLAVVLERGSQNGAKPFVQGGVLHWSDRLHTSIEVPLHPIRGSDVELLGSPVREIRHARVLEETANDADDTNIVAHARDTRTQAADTADDEID